MDSCPRCLTFPSTLRSRVPSPQVAEQCITRVSNWLKCITSAIRLGYFIKGGGSHSLLVAGAVHRKQFTITRAASERQNPTLFCSPLPSLISAQKHRNSFPVTGFRQVLNWQSSSPKPSDLTITRRCQPPFLLPLPPYRQQT